MSLTDKVRKNRKTVAAVVLIIVACAFLFKPPHTDIFSSVDKKSDEYLNKTIKKATITYAGLRTMNAVISVIQSISINATLKIPFVASGGGSISIGEIFDPVNDLIERCSVVVLFALASLGIQKIILNVSPYVSFNLLLPISLLLFALSMWKPFFRGFSFGKAALKIAVFALVVRFCIPFAALLNEKVGTLVLDQKYEETRSEIVDLEDSLNEAKADFQITTRIKSVLDNLKNTVSGKISYFVDMIIIFVFQTALIPLAVLFLIVKLPGFAVNSLSFTNNSETLKQKE